MLITEWSTEKAKEVWQREAREDGRVEGRVEGREETAKNMLLDNIPPDKISKYTGLNMDTIKKLAAQ
jgi:predicted transposase YdaD